MQHLADFKNRRVLVMGLGLHGGGVGTAKFFAKLGSRVLVTDLKARRELASSLAKLKRFRNIVYHLGGHRAADFKTADYVIKGPGVPESSPYLKIAKRAGVPILSDVQIFFRACPAPIVGVTGTKGKTTTAWLIGEFLKKGSKNRIWVGGNIRRSVLEFLRRVRKGDRVVLELSSFQLDSLAESQMSPAIAVITNIFADHLNRYGSMAAYARSKAAIFRFQGTKGTLIINGRDPVLRRLSKQARGRVLRFDPERTIKPYAKILAPNIPDYHRPNIALAVAVARRLGVGERAMRSVLATFRGVPGRMELVRRRGEVEFINDTTATNPTAAARAVAAVRRRIGRKRRLAVIAGGYDKGLPVAEFAGALAENADAVIWLPGKATQAMQRRLGQTRRPHGLAMADAKSMAEAVRAAFRRARPEGVVLLSPGAASFGLFVNEFDRGDQFVRAVKALR